jgi:lysophospholipase L1-like esterase
MHTYIKIFLFFALYSISTLHAVTKIMPLGDSITWDWHFSDGRSDAYRSGYRNYLWYKLKDAGYDVNFVGSQHNGGAVRPAYDGHNEGYTGWTSHRIADKIYSLLEKNTPDIILLHIGTNDPYYSISDNANGVTRILNEIDRFEKNKGIKIHVVLAQIINMYKYRSWVDSFNKNLTAIAKNRIRSGDNITLVNMQSAVGWNLVDGLHPNNTGYNQMANVWFKALKDIMKDDYAYLIPIYGLLLQ